jgi:hypothetical protein
MATLGYRPQPAINTTSNTSHTKTCRQQSQQYSASQRHRSASPPQRQSNPVVRGHISESNIAIGTIVYLAPKNPDQESCTCVLPNCRRRTLADAGYDHPTVVLNIWDKRPIGGEIMTLCCTVRQPQPDLSTVQTLNLGRCPPTHNRSDPKHLASLPLPDSRKEIRQHRSPPRTERPSSTSSRRAPCTSNHTFTTLTSTPFRFRNSAASTIAVLSKTA